MQESFITLKEVPINNNCPECFNKSGMKIVFKQKFIETKFYRSITDIITEDILCDTCKTTIYPVRWTEDIERVVEYQRKVLTTKKASTHYKKTTWILGVFILLTLLIIASSIIYLEIL